MYSTNCSAGRGQVSSGISNGSDSVSITDFSEGCESSGGCGRIVSDGRSEPATHTIEEKIIIQKTFDIIMSFQSGTRKQCRQLGAKVNTDFPLAKVRQN